MERVLQKKNDLNDYKKCKLPKNEIYNHFNDIFKKIISKFDDIDSFEILTQTDNLVYNLTEEQKEKFEKIYCCSPNNDIQSFEKEEWIGNIKKEDIGINEFRLIKFCIDNSSGKTVENNLHFLSAQCGRGKSSLLLYSLIFLRSKSVFLQSRFFPIIFNLHTNKSELDNVPLNELESHIKKRLIEPKIIQFFSYLFLISNEQFWLWYENQSLKTSYKIEVENTRIRFRNDTSKLLDIIYELRETEIKTIDFCIHCLRYLKEYKNVNVIIVFDNLDPFNIDFIEKIFWISKNIINYSGNNVKIVLTLRKETLTKLDKKTNGILRIENGFIEVSTIDIVNKRCTAIEESIKSEEIKKPLYFDNIKITLTQSPVNIFKSFLNIIKSQKGVDLIRLFSNNNIRFQLDLFEVIFSSYLIPVQLFRTLLMSNSNNEIIIPESQIVKAIVTNGYTTFFSFLTKHQSDNIPGVINILSSAYNQDEFTLFSKLMLLSYLHKKHADINISIDKIFNDLDLVLAHFDRDEESNYKASFYHALTRFLNQGLITSPDTEKVIGPVDFKRFVTEISITSLGSYYLNILLSEPEYIMYAKDDTYVYDNTQFNDCNTVYKTNKQERVFYTNIYETIKFLDVYFEMEINLYDKLIEKRAWFIFKDLYSCPNGTFYTSEILKGVEKTFNVSAKEAASKHFLIDNQEFLSEIPNATSELKNKISKLSKKYF